MTYCLDKYIVQSLPFGVPSFKRQMPIRGTYLLFFLFLATGIAAAQAVTTQSLTLEVKAVSKISVSGSPNALIINDAIPGSNLTSVQDENTSYSITSNLDNMKIVASINTQMPAGTNLMIRLKSGKGTSRGLTDLSNALTPVDVVTGIVKGTDNNQGISYVFAANADVASIPLDSRVVTLTLTD